MNKILLIEDEQHVAEILIKGLEEDEFRVTHATDGIYGMQLLEKETYQLILLDILLPHMNGLEVCKRIRDSGFTDIPILMLTALGSAENVVLGLESGADDYLAKPFKLIELKARIRNLLRRTESSDRTPAGTESIYRFADVELNDNTKTVTRSGVEISLTSTEYRLLLMFMKNPRRVLSRTELLEDVWGINHDIGTNVVDVYVNYLRKKLDVQKGEKIIHTVIGMGYALKKAG